MIKVSSKELSFLTPERYRDDSYQKRVEKFLTDKGFQVPQDLNEIQLKDAALAYWKSHNHPYLTEAAWLHAYCEVLKIDLHLS